MSAPHQRDSAGEPGEVIDGRFRLEVLLGEGGMAKVFRARELATGRALALKLLKAQPEQSQAEARLRREAEVLRSIEVPAVVRIEAYGRTADGRLYIAMELLEGETFGQLLRRRQRLQPDALAPIVTGVAAGLGAAHAAGIVHRDLKPDNVFLAQTEPGEPIQVKLLDFGISKVYGVQERLTRTGQVLGTPRYMAPEQLSAERDLDARVDVYALGVMLYEALSGGPPFGVAGGGPSALIIAIIQGKATPLRSVRPDLSPELEAVVMRAMARVREARFASVHELAEAFLDMVSGATSSDEVPRGKSTAFMAQVEAPVGATPEPRPLRLGTFSAFARPPAAQPSSAQSDGQPGAVPTASPQPGPAQGVSAPPDPPQPAGPGARQSASGAEAGGLAMSETPAFAPEAQPAPGAEDSPSALLVSGEDVRLPLRGPGLGPLLLALLAGAISAAVAIALLRAYGDDGTSREPAPPPAHSAPTVEAASDSSTDVAGPGPHPAPVPSMGESPAEAESARPRLPSGADPPPPAMHSMETRRAAPRPRRRRSREAAEVSPAAERNPAPMEVALPPPYANEQASNLELAQRALAAHDPSRCVELLRGERGPTALRLEGDCRLRSGERDDAVKAYERFCQLYPSHVGIDRVRELVMTYGGSCP